MSLPYSHFTSRDLSTAPAIFDYCCSCLLLCQDPFLFHFILHLGPRDHLFRKSLRVVENFNFFFSRLFRRSLLVSFFVSRCSSWRYMNCPCWCPFISEPGGISLAISLFIFSLLVAGSCSVWSRLVFMDCSQQWPSFCTFELSKLDPSGERERLSNLESNLTSIKI